MRKGARWGALLLALGAPSLSACGGHHHRAATVPTPRISIPAPVSRDVWNPPALTGGPSTGTFCAGLIADYRHTQQNQIATTTAVKKAILNDFVQYTPRVEAVAPAEIGGPASTYLGAEVQVIKILLAANLDVTKAPEGSIGTIIDSPAVRAAGQTFDTWSEQNCHFDITSDGT